MDIAFELTPLTACKLIVYSFGALVYLFLMVLILGQRRLRRHEWLVFALMSALFMWNSGNLLALNVGLAYGLGPTTLGADCSCHSASGFSLDRSLARTGPRRVCVPGIPSFRLRSSKSAFHQPAGGRFLPAADPDPAAPSECTQQPRARASNISRGLLASTASVDLLALFLGVALNLRLRRRAEHPQLRALHGRLAGLECALAVGLCWRFLLHPLPGVGLGDYFPTLLMALVVIPGILLGQAILRYNFLELRVQRSVIYSAVAVFALLIYIDFIRRLSGYLDDRAILPAAVTEALMIFVMVVFLEPVKKRIDRVLQAAFRSEIDRVQKLATEIQNYAKQTADLRALAEFVETRVPQELGLKGAKLHLGALHQEVSAPPGSGSTVHKFSVRRADDVIAVLEVTPLKAGLSGDHVAALELLAEQLAAAIELCQLVSDKVQLERALAEKAKLAFLGEMAARIAHNVKNPLSSMKTLVQLLEEDSSLPERVRHDCRMVVAEIDRLNANISQVLRYARPARDTGGAVDLGEAVRRIVALTRPEAERRRVKLEFAAPPGSAMVEGGNEAVDDILSNLLVNALEASPAGGTVRISILPVDGASAGNGNSRPGGVGGSNAKLLELTIEDQGAGVAAGLDARSFSPFSPLARAVQGLVSPSWSAGLRKLGALWSAKVPSRTERVRGSWCDSKPPNSESRVRRRSDGESNRSEGGAGFRLVSQADRTTATHRPSSKRLTHAHSAYR